MKSLAIIYLAKNKPLKLDEIEISDPGPEQVLVKLYASGICHSQLINLNRDPLRPELLGHEGTGKVLKKGSNVNHLKEGDDILISWMPHKYDPNTKYLEWSSIRYKGKKITTLIFTWSKYSLMHHQFITKLPKKVDKYSCSILGCAGIAGYGTVYNTVKIKRSDSVAIFGSGGLGLLAVNAARNLGAKKIIVIDIKDKKLSFSKKFGATHLINSRNRNPVSEIKKITNGKGVDYAFDMVGKIETQNFSLLSTKEGIPGYEIGGSIILTGFPREKLELNTRDVLMGQKTIIGSRGGGVIPKIHFPKFYTDIIKGKLLLKQVVTNVFKLDQINLALKLLKTGKILGRAIIRIS